VKSRWTRRWVLLLAWALPLPVVAGPGDAPAPAGGEVGNDTVWEGRVDVERTVTVAGGATLTVRPGTVVSFRPGAALVVEGSLVARGEADARVRFVPESGPSPAGWEGIRFAESSTGSTLSRCEIRGAAAVDVAGAGVEIRDCEFGNGKTGMVFRGKADSRVTGNVIRDMSEGGIRCFQGATPRIERNVLRGCRPFGISCGKGAAPVIRDNEVTDCNHGLTVHGSIPPVEGNVFRENDGGIVLTWAGSGQTIRGNRFEQNGTGLFCEQFSDPLVEENAFRKNKVGVICFRSSSPVIRRNEIEENGEGILCNQMCHPRIEGNEIRGNGKGISLTLSSYATVNGNNIHGNEVQMELGNMSSDWERRVREKPIRGRSAQMVTQAERGIAGTRDARQPKADNVAIAGSVDATGNWWGEKDTAEMERKGADADIAGLVDFHDVPVRTYEGYPGEYLQDRIRYDGWRKTRITDAGIPRAGKEAGK
jgi:parallel beta-helix repeat protein